MAEETMRGRLFSYSDQGVGPHWAFQDEGFIYNDGSSPDSEVWNPAGFHLLQLGDYLKATNLNGEIIFEGKLIFGSASSNLQWYPKGITKKAWAKLFRDLLPGEPRPVVELTPVASKRIQIAVGRSIVSPFVHIESFEDYTASDTMMSEIFTYVVTVAKYFPNRKKPSRFQLYFTPRNSKCGCIYKKEGHICICDRLPEDILSSIKPL